MATPQEIESMLVKLTQATQDAKTATAEAHAARRDLRDEMKRQRDAITDAIVAEVATQVGALADGVRADMENRVNVVIDGLAADWRRALGLV